MTNLGAFELILFFVLTGCFYWWLWTSNDRGLRKSITQQSRMIKVAGSGTLFIPHFDPYVGSESIVYLPTGDGLYHTRTKAKRSKHYRDGIERWLVRGAKVHLVVTQPNSSVEREWQSVKREFPTQLYVHILFREKIAEIETRELIETLDTFHPVILINPPGDPGHPGAMWIESYHPLKSKYAYNIEFVVPQDAQRDTRLKKYEAMYCELLSSAYSLGGDEPAEKVISISQDYFSPPQKHVAAA